MELHGNCSHLQRCLIEERDELSREKNNHLLSQELCGARDREIDSKRKKKREREETKEQIIKQVEAGPFNWRFQLGAHVKIRKFKVKRKLGLSTPRLAVINPGCLDRIEPCPWDKWSRRWMWLDLPDDYSSHSSVCELWPMSLLRMYIYLHNFIFMDSRYNRIRNQQVWGQKYPWNSFIRHSHFLDRAFDNTITNPVFTMTKSM